MSISKSLSIALVAVAAAIAAPGAFAADDGGLPKAAPATGSAKTRAEVKTDRAMAAKSGELSQNANANPMGDKASVGTKKTRAQVKSETAAAKKADGGTLKTPKE